MAAISEQLLSLQSQADLDRKRGEALRKHGREAEAQVSFEAALLKLQRCLEMLDQAQWQHDSDLARLRADMLGTCAGILRRLNRDADAYQRYLEGAGIEQQFGLSSTYNRVNELKYALITSAATLASLQDRARAVAELLYRTLSDPATQKLGDDGWAWADLGDCRGLLGELTEAGRAYSTFIAKAGPKAPESTIAVLDKIAAALERGDDPDRQRVTEMIAALRSQMRAPPQAGAR